MKSVTLQSYTNQKLSKMLMALTLLASCGEKAQVAAVLPQVPSASSPVYPLKVSANGRYLVDQNNTPFLIVGDVPQPLVVMVSTADASELISTIARLTDSMHMWINVLSAGPYYRDYSGGRQHL